MTEKQAETRFPGSIKTLRNNYRWSSVMEFYVNDKTGFLTCLCLGGAQGDWNGETWTF